MKNTLKLILNKSNVIFKGGFFRGQRMNRMVKVISTIRMEIFMM